MRSEKEKLHRNITLNNIIGSLMWGRFFIPVLALFYIASKVTLEQFTIITAVFALTTLLLEIPTGVIADLLGKKKTLLISRALYVIEIVMIAFFDGFWVFLIAKIISGMGVSFGSGTNQALLYDTLKKLGREKEHKHIAGKAKTISNISMAAVFIIGAYLFTLHPKLPAIASLIPIGLGFILTFSLHEPYKTTKVQGTYKHLKEGLHTFRKNYELKYLALFTLFAGSIITILLNLSSIYLEMILIPVATIGIVSLGMMLAAAFGANKAQTLEEKLGEKRSLQAISVMLFLLVFALALLIPYAGIALFLLLCFTQGYYEVIIGDYVNSRVDSKHRATMLSINNMFDNIGIAIVFPIVGLLNKSLGMHKALLFLGAYAVVYAVLLIITYKQKRHI